MTGGCCCTLMRENSVSTWRMQVVKSLQLLGKRIGSSPYVNKSSVDASDQFTSTPSITYRSAGVELDVVVGDLEAIKVAVDKAWECFGCIDAPVNKAGVGGNFAIYWQHFINICRKL